MSATICLFESPPLKVPVDAISIIGDWTCARVLDSFAQCGPISAYST